MRRRDRPVVAPAVTRAAGWARLSTARAAVVLAVLAGLFGMHGLGAGHASVTMDAPVTSAHAMVDQVPVSLPGGPAGDTGTTELAPTAVLSGQSGAGGAEHGGHTGMTSMTCVAVLATATALTRRVFRRALARRRARPSRPAPVHTVARRVTPRVVVLPRALSLSQLCVMRV